MKTRATRLLLSVAALLIVSGFSTATLAGTYNVTFGVTVGGPAPSGTVTFADPEPAGTATATIIAFEVSDGTSTWTETDATGGFGAGGFDGGALQFLSIKAYDAPTGRAIEIFSSIPGTYVVCNSGDPTNFCLGGSDTEGSYTFAAQQVPGMTFWGGTILLLLMLTLMAFRLTRTRSLKQA